MKVMERRKFGNLYTHHFAIGRTLEGNDGEGLLAPRDLTLPVHSGETSSCPHDTSAWDNAIPLPLSFILSLTHAHSSPFPHTKANKCPLTPIRVPNSI